jgi:hypothetical protein
MTHTISFTKHAICRIEQMGITQAQVRQAVNEPEVVVPADNTRDRYGNQTGRRKQNQLMYRKDDIAVVGATEGSSDDVLVITILERRSDQYQRTA